MGKVFPGFSNKISAAGGKIGAVRLFSEKLRSKGQAEGRVEQAADAVSLFFEPKQTQKETPSSNCTGAFLQAVDRGVQEMIENARTVYDLINRAKKK